MAEVGEEPGGEFGYWPIEELPPRVVAATVAIEDRRFWGHPGVDPLAIARALRQNLTERRRISGASTLAMQVARMQHPGARGYARKTLETLTAVFMTLHHGRQGVLRQYLRVVPYGNRIHGIGYAARRYLDKPVEDLSWAEIAFLAAIPQSPARMNPFDPEGRARAQRRGALILDLLRAQGTLSAEEHSLAREQIQELRVPPAGERPVFAMHAVLRLGDLLRDPRAQTALTRRPVVRTTLDREMQRRVAEITREAIREFQPEGAGNAAVVLVDRRSNEVRAWVGSGDYFDTQHAGAIDYARRERSPGSALKPFFYGLALERGALTPATVLDDLERGPEGIANADGMFLGPLLPRTALGNSRNVPAADVLGRVGLDEGYALLRDLGLHQSRKPARHYGLGLALGSLPVTLEKLVRAYGVLAGDGRLRDLVWFEGQPMAEPRRLLSEDTARQVTLFLADPQARLPSFARMGALEYPFPVAVKTGTSSRFRDAWTVGYTSRYVAGVWVGDPDYRPMNRLTGYRAAAELLHRVLLDLHRDQSQGLDDLPFPPPRGFVARRLCALTGQLATPHCERICAEWFRPGDEPQDDCRAHVRLPVDARSGAVARPGTPREHVAARVFVDLPPRYAAWATRAGLPAPPRPDGADIAWPGHVRLTVTSPQDGLRLLRDPETPPENATVALRVLVDPPVSQLVWYVDGRPFAVVDAPYTARWRLEPGEHFFEARLARAPGASGRVRVRVQ